jgi:hypothetical protein
LNNLFFLVPNCTIMSLMRTSKLKKKIKIEGLHCAAVSTASHGLGSELYAVYGRSDIEILHGKLSEKIKIL